MLVTTLSICPVCHQIIPAGYVREKDCVVLKKDCPEHGSFSVPVWRGEPDFKKWQQDLSVRFNGEPACDLRCAGCTKHISPVCCVVLEITDRCNMHCPFCLAAAGEHDRETMTFEQVTAALDDLYEMGVRSVHFGGGEPTVRDDLPEITAYAAGKGFEYIQLNTNGIRLAGEKDYALKLREAGISSVFLQFDGTDDDIYMKTRGRALTAVKEKAIEQCDRAVLGVVLVPTLVPGVNSHDIGGIVRYAVEHMPAVRGIHFQPVTYMGRVPDETNQPHITIPEVINAIEIQTDGLIKATDLHPSVADASLCGFHGEFRKSDHDLVPLPHREKGPANAAGSCCSCSAGNVRVVNALGETLDLESAVRRSQNHVKNKWTRKISTKKASDNFDLLLQELLDRNFSVSAMAFQDSANMDLKRLMQCTLRVYRNGILVPFCLAHTLEEQYR